MQLTRFTDYALRVLIYAGLNAERKITIGELAEKYKIPKNHLLKVVHQLTKEGLLNSKRGRGGGLTVGKSLKSITVGYVVRRFEPRLNLVECNKPRCVLSVGCVLKQVLEEGVQEFLNVLDRYTIADLIHNQDSMKKQLGLTLIT